jgi:hypothetical protein
MEVEIKKQNVREIMSDNYLFQYDYGQKLRVKGINSSASSLVVHFSTNYLTQAIEVLGTFSGKELIAGIPDQLLNDKSQDINYYIYAYIYVVDDTSGTTEYKIIIPVRAREQKSSETPTPAQKSEFEEVVANVNAAAKTASDAAQVAADKAAETYAASADIDTLKSDVSSLKTNLTNASNKADTNAKAITNLQSDLTTLSATVKDAQNSIFSISSEQKELIEDVRELQSIGIFIDSDGKFYIEEDE